MMKSFKTKVMEKLKKKLFITGAVAASFTLVVLFSSTQSCTNTEKTYEVKRGKFEAVLNYKGEINGLNSVEVKTPPILNDMELRLGSFKIVDLVADGKEVKKGEFIVQLDGDRIMEGMREDRQNLEREMADLNNAKIDSAVRLTQLREEITNALLDLEYNRIDLEQSVYESAAYQRKAKMTFQKAENNIAQKKRDYRLEESKLAKRVERAQYQVDRINERLGKFNEAMRALRITAPTDGIIIFGSSWEGTKHTKDSRIMAYEFAPPIATLPDMSKVVSEIYLKEIDVAKVNVGDSVLVSFDAVENLKIRGTIKNIARMGEDHNDYDMKVFKVQIYLDKSDEKLKPAMSSSNDIVLTKSDSALFIPLNAVYKENGTLFSYKKTDTGPVKQTIVTGLQNDQFIEIISGLEEGDLVYLEAPSPEQITAQL